MIQYRNPVRLNTPQELDYTFQDMAGVIIDLTPYVSVSLEVKVQGAVYSTVAAVFSSPQTSGLVKTASYTFTAAGTWTVQFVCVDSGGNKLFGEPLQVNVYDNVEDLVIDQLLGY